VAAEAPVQEEALELTLPPVQVTSSGATVDPTIMTEDQRVALAESLLADISGVSVAKMPAEPPALETARSLALPVDLPENYAYLGAVEKAKVLEAALDQLQSRNKSLVGELEARTQWEAVRLSTLLRERSEEETARSKQAIMKALEIQKETFDMMFAKQRTKLEGEAEVVIAQQTAQLKVWCACSLSGEGEG